MGPEREGDQTKARMEPGALDALYRRYAGWLTAVVGKRYGAANAEDLVQETYVRVSRYGGEGEIRHPQGLLLRIAANLAYNRTRQAAQDRRKAERLAEITGGDEPYTNAEQHEALLFKQVVEALPQPLRDTYMLSRYAGMTYVDISQHCRLPLKTVEWRMSKALALIAEQMRDQEP